MHGNSVVHRQSGDSVVSVQSQGQRVLVEVDARTAICAMTTVLLLFMLSKPLHRHEKTKL